MGRVGWDQFYPTHTLLASLEEQVKRMDARARERELNIMDYIY
jgi:hypothetical protein